VIAPTQAGARVGSVRLPGWCVVVVVAAACGSVEVTPNRPVSAVEVLDGDTFEAPVDGEVRRVRLIGVNAPEDGECLSERAAARLKELLAGDVTLTVDRTDADRFGRLLRHVWVDGELVSEVLVEEGLALAVSYPPDTEHDGRLSDAERRAREARIGIWAECVQASDLVISAARFDAPGDDGQNPNGEWIEVENRGLTLVNLSGWSVRDRSSSNRYTFPTGFTLDPGAVVRLRSGCGQDTQTELHWCADRTGIWTNTGDTAFLLNPDGGIVDVFDG